MIKRNPKSEQIKEQMHKLMSGQTEYDNGEQMLSAFIRLAVQKVLQEGLEAEVSQQLGREHYQHRKEDSPAGHRNGYREDQLDTAEGPIPYWKPQVRATNVQSKLLDGLASRSQELIRLVIESYVRGLSTRDLEQVFTRADGECLVSKSTVSQLTESLNEEYEAFRKRDLSGLQLEYLFVDGVAEKLRQSGRQREAVLVAWGILHSGERVLIHVAPGNKESFECCLEFFRDLKRRQLQDPLLGTTDGAPGLIKAFEQVFDKSARQRCLSHRMRNVVDKLPEDPEVVTEVKAYVNACWNAPNTEAAYTLKEQCVQKFGQEYPAAMAVLEEDFDACIAHLQFPKRHHKFIRTTNLLERLFLEERRRTKINPNMFGERAVMKLMYSTMLRAQANWRPIPMSRFEQKQLERMRQQMLQKNHRGGKRVSNEKKRVANLHQK